MTALKITVHLDTVRRYRNKHEYREVGRARSSHHEVVGEAALLRPLLKKIHADGAPIEAIVEVFRGDTLCFRPAPLKAWIFLGENPIKKRCNQRTQAASV